MNRILHTALLAALICINAGVQERSNASRQTPAASRRSVSTVSGSRATNHASDSTPRTGSPSYVASPSSNQSASGRTPQGSPSYVTSRPQAPATGYSHPLYGNIGLMAHQPYPTMTAEYHRQKALSVASMPVYTFYDINSPVGGGVSLDPSMRRPSIETLSDTAYRPLIGRLDDVHMPPYPAKGKEDPFLDDTHSIFSNHTTTAGGDADLINASYGKDVVALELFGFSQLVPYDIVEPVRTSVYNGFVSRNRHYILDAQTVLGGVYDGSAVYYGGRPGTVFHFTPRMDKLYCAGVRYVVSGFISQYYTRSYHLSNTSKTLYYESMLTLHLTAYDLDNKTIMQTKVITLHNTGSSLARADKYLIDMVDSYVDDFFRANFRIVTTMSDLGNFKKNGKAKSCLVSTGSALGLESGDCISVYTPGNVSLNYLGSLKVTSDITEESAACVISFGAKKVTQAFQSGAELILMTD